MTNFKFNKEYSTFFIIALTIIIAVLFLLAVHNLYSNTLQDEKIKHQNQQLEMIRTAETGINFYIKHLVEDILFLSQSIPFERKNYNTNLFIQQFDDEDIESIVYYNNQNNSLFLKGHLFPNSIKRQLDSLINRKKLKEKEIWFSDIVASKKNTVKENLYFTIVTPVFKSNFNENPNSFGLVSVVINFNSLINKFISTLKLSESDFAWILDGKGRLIYHPRHDEMILKSIVDSTNECTECHNSFETQKKMIQQNNFTGEYIVSGEPTKIMASNSIKLNNKKWVIAISTFLPDITRTLRSRFRYFFILGFFILLVIFIFGSLLYKSNARRIRAEDETKILEQNQLYQEQLNQYAKLASIGELVDSVAHEINTPLGIISTHVDVLNLNKNYPDQFKEELHVIKNQTRRINNYTKSLLSYSHRLPYEPKPYLLNEILDECLYLLGPKLKKKNISVVKLFDKKIKYVNVDRGQIEQVIFNCLNNSIDAIENKIGKIKLITSLKTNTNYKDENTQFNCLIIEIWDNGTGIEPENLNKIFEPFYTTKLHNKGTGLGLSISKAIINRHLGKIEIESKLGEFTYLKISLPFEGEIC